jgi:hypothetical protein
MYKIKFIIKTFPQNMTPLLNSIKYLMKKQYWPYVFFEEMKAFQICFSETAQSITKSRVLQENKIKNECFLWSQMQKILNVIYKIRFRNINKGGLFQECKDSLTLDNQSMLLFILTEERKINI